MVGVAMGNEGGGSGGSAPEGGFPLGLRCWGLLGHPWEVTWGRGWAQWGVGCPGTNPAMGPLSPNPGRAQGTVSPSPGGPQLAAPYNAPPPSPLLCPQAPGRGGGEGPVPG